MSFPLMMFLSSNVVSPNEVFLIHVVSPNDVGETKSGLTFHLSHTKTRPRIYIYMSPPKAVGETDS